MQTETLNSLIESGKHHYLRVATVSGKSALSFFYIGNNLRTIQALESNFLSGIVAEDFASAKAIIEREVDSEGQVDIFVIDVPYHAAEIRGFRHFLNAKGESFAQVPVIYHSGQVADHNSVDTELIDDVIDVSNWQYDFASKVGFLKKMKEYDQKPFNVERIKPANCTFKRIFDVLASSVLLLLLLPIFLLIALAIRLESKGPVFYNAKRAGRGFRIFKFYKFRTMVVNADKKIEALAHLNQYNGTSNARFFKISNDPRITKVGKFLRNTSLDELPQLFNVLKGDMSLVGNRPLPLYEASTLTTNEYVERFVAPAGITGLWQIKKRGQAEMSVEERISLDIAYARKFNLLYDFWIMANTPGALFQKSNV